MPERCRSAIFAEAGPVLYTAATSQHTDRCPVSCTNMNRMTDYGQN